MGIVRMGPPHELMLQLKSEFRLSDFIETGTYFGATARWAAAHFERVTTIENSRKLYEEAVARHAETKNIEFLFGDSRSVLKTVVASLNHPALFWLDSHWSGGDTYGTGDECPLLEELGILNTSAFDHFVFIDDARLFLSPPPPPHRMENWPSLAEVMDEIRRGIHRDYIVVCEDVIMSVPNRARGIVAQYCRQVREREEQRRSVPENQSWDGWKRLARRMRSLASGLAAPPRHARKP